MSRKSLNSTPEVVTISELKPLPVFLGTIIVALAMLLVRVEDALLRLQISDVAVFLTVLFFYVLQREDTENLEEKIEKLEDLV